MQRLTRLFCAISILAAPVSAYAQAYVDFEKDFECTVFLRKEKHTRASQGLEMSGKYVFSFQDGGHCNVYNFRTASSEPIGGFDLVSSGKDNHVNNVEFGVEKAPGGSFPMLYISNGKVGSDLEWSCFVESIKRRGRSFSSELVQTIVLDVSKWDEKGSARIFGAPSWLVDRKRGFLWVFSAKKRTIASVTRDPSENEYIATKFRIPSLSEGKRVVLGVDDVLDQVIFPFEVWFTQAGCMDDGKIYYCFGVGKDMGNEGRPAHMRIYDTDSGKICARYDLVESVPQEPEDLVLRKGYIYLNANIGKPAVQCIYRISLPRSK
jgi:hypothetical protein